MAAGNTVAREAVYLLCDGWCVKIGRTSGRIATRIAALQTGSSRKIKAVLAVRFPLSHSAIEVERYCHRTLEPYRTVGEWFRCSKTTAIATLVSASFPYIGKEWLIADRSCMEQLKQELEWRSK
jgi:hypothetical protein